MAWFRRFLSPRVRFYTGVTLLIGSFIGWPLSALTWAKDEPPFVLGLSWLAVILTAFDIINSALVSLEKE